MKSFRFLAPLVLAGLPLLARAQDPPELAPVGIKLGFSLGEEVGLHGGADLRIPRLPLRVDADVWSGFAHFGSRNDGFAATVNYLSIQNGYYFGVGPGYIRGRSRSDEFDSLALKAFVGVPLPFAHAFVEGGFLWGQHALGSSHTVGTVSLVWRF